MPIGAFLVEDAVDRIIGRMRQQFNVNLSLVYEQQGGKIDLPYIELNRFYVSEAIEPLQAPAVFVIADGTEHSLDDAQNFASQAHAILVNVLVEDVEIQRLVRKTWRYVRAAYMTLHDQSFGNIHTLVEAVDYGPVLRPVEGASRQFRKDATLRLRALQLESF